MVYCCSFIPEGFGVAFEAPDNYSRYADDWLRGVIDSCIGEEIYVCGKPPVGSVNEFFGVCRGISDYKFNRNVNLIKLETGDGFESPDKPFTYLELPVYYILREKDRMGRRVGKV
jgi:hypothetical protein